VKNSSIILVLALALGCALPAHAAEQTTRIVTLYRIAPGQHVAFMKWLSVKEQAEREAGIPNSQIFVHETGAGWDFLMIDSGTEASPAQLAAYEKATQRLGVLGGVKAWVEIRKFMADHEDMVVSGPTTATEWLKELRK
jgi:hypothetical protein